MLSIEKFVEGMTFLDVYYSNFKFFEKTFTGAIELKKKVWYEVFKDMGDEAFLTLIKRYSLENIYAPQSPTHLLDYGKKIFKENMLPSEEAWNLLYETLKENARTDHSTMITYYDVDKTLSSIGDTHIKDVASRMVELLRSERDYYRWQTVKKTFIERYENVKTDTLFTNEKILIGNKD